jgi:glycosyltransferase involved in cell wall biosynthesis
MDLSIIVPVYNEEKNIKKLLDKLLSVKFKKKPEIIVVNDGSTDNSAKIIKTYAKKNKNIVYVEKENQGKGSALVEGIKRSKGKVVTIQDADLEYDPAQIKTMLDHFKKHKLQVLYGSRFLGKNYKVFAKDPIYKHHLLGNKFLSLLISLLYRRRVTDMETCRKMVNGSLIRSLKLSAKKFDIEVEITSKILRRKIKIHEIPIDYTPRTFAEGKKINWRDGVQAVLAMLKYRFF